MPVSPPSLAALLALTTLAACAARPPASSPATSHADAPAPPSAPAPAAPAPAPPPAALTGDAALLSYFDQLLGPWAGSGESPFGEMPFAALFERQPDGGVRSWLDDGHGSNIDLLFHRTPAGWRLTESATLPGVGTQRHTLVPELAGADRLVLRHPDQPALLTVELQLLAAPAGGARQLRLLARVRGEDHVDFLLRRLPDEAVESLRRKLHPPGTSPAIASRTLAP